MYLAQTIKYATPKRFGVVYIGALALFFVSRINFLIFHSIIEFICIVLAISIHIISRNVNAFHKNSDCLQLGICYGVVASFDILHTIAYEGFTILSIGNANLATQLWVAARFIECFGLFFIFYMASSKQAIELSAYTYAVGSISIVLLSLILLKVFPMCYVSGYGLTWFKIISEIVFCIITCSTLYFLEKDKKSYDANIFNLLYMYVIARIASGIFFAVYVDLFGLLNSLGHIFKFVAYCFLYTAIVEIILKGPYRELEKKTIEMKRINEVLNEEIKQEEAIQRELKNQYEFLRITLNSIPNPIFFKNSKGVYGECNKAFEICFGLEREDILGKTIFEIEDRLKAARLCQIDSLATIDRETEYLECELECADGKKHDVVLNRGIIADNLGEATGLVGVVIDITESRRSEENERLFNQIREMDRLKTEFFSNISHELRTPLNVLLGALQLMELHMSKEGNYIEGHNIVRYSYMMKQNCYRLLRLVNNLIDITKMDSGYFKLNLINNDIVRTIEDITMSVAEYIENKGLGLKFDTNVEEKFIAFDCDKIERIMLNLLSNAVKFTKPGGNIFVNIIDQKDKIIFTVKDDGIGIPKEKQKEIFDRFFQVDDLMTRKREGSGIGLSLVKAIVEMHSGRIYVESEEDKGSEFFVELPVKMVATSEDSKYENIHINSSNIERIKIEFSDIYA